MLSQKCNRYPECECYKDWEKSANEIDPENAELFVTIKQEIQSFLDKAKWIKYKPVSDKIKSKLTLLPPELQGLFISKLLPFIEFHYSWKIPENSDLEKLRKSLIEVVSANYELDYYTNETNIPNQEYVRETIEYFDKGEGARAFRPLEFLNLFERQFQFLKLNFKNGEKVLTTLKSLPLSEIERHILFGFILKWTGGYPVNNLDEDFDKTLKLIQKEFLDYEGDTPEKEFCKTDRGRQKKFMKLEIALTTAINHNIDAEWFIMP